MIRSENGTDSSEAISIQYLFFYNNTLIILLIWIVKYFFTYRMDVILIGAGTLSKLVIDILNNQNKCQIIGIYDNTIEKGVNKNGYPILGDIDDAFNSTVKNVIICIGDQKARKELFLAFENRDFMFPNVIANNAIISNHCTIEYGCIIGFFSTVLYDSFIGKGTFILNNVNVNHNTVIKEFGLLGVGVSIGNDSILEEGVHVAMGQIILPSSTINSWKYIQ